MKILADENIPYVREAFASLGDVVTMSGRAMTRDDTRDAELLLVRSITKVNAGLLEGTRVRFVATATIGEDHVDKAYLAEYGIAFSSAPGCNANSVAQYVVSSLLALEEDLQYPLEGRKIGVVGVGNVGSRVARQTAALGLTPVLNDPPLARSSGDPVYRPIDEIFECDIVTLHVPLTRQGPDATFHLVDEAFIQCMKPGSILINSSRGPVADGAVLLAALRRGQPSACILDVWEGEPKVDPELLQTVYIGTPHIAGYSFDGKVNGTRQIYEAACAFLGEPPAWDPSPLLPVPECPQVVVDGTCDIHQALRQAVFPVYDARSDSRNMKAMCDRPEAECAPFFDRLRKEYPRRREPFNTRAIIRSANPSLARRLTTLGFQVIEEQA